MATIPPAPLPAVDVAPDKIDKVTLLLVSGLSRETILAAAQAKLGLSAADAEKAISEARRRITLAADYNRVEQIGTGVTRLNDLYARCTQAQDLKTALACQRELHKLLDLYATADQPNAPTAGNADAGDAEQLRKELAAIREHLEPLGLAPADYPLRELARMAAEIVRQEL
jgi:hypothetical protein